MKWQLLAMGLGWMKQLFRQYRKMKQTYDQKDFHYNQINQLNFNVNENKKQINNKQKDEQNAQNPKSSTSIDDMVKKNSKIKQTYSTNTQQNKDSNLWNKQQREGNLQKVEKIELQNQNQNYLQRFNDPFLNDNDNKILDQTKDNYNLKEELQLQYVVFPQLYPHLKKYKAIKKRRNQRNQSYITQNQLRTHQLKKKRQLKKYKQWFFTNRILMEFKQEGHLSESQIKKDYEKLSHSVKKNIIDDEDNKYRSKYNSIKNHYYNDQPDEINKDNFCNKLNQISEVIIKKDPLNKSKASIKTESNKKLLNFLQEQKDQLLQNNPFNQGNKNKKIQKYDPFSY